MPDPTAEFFQRLDRSRPPTLSGLVSGAIRFDLEYDQRVDHWLLAIDKGVVRASQENRAADCVVQAKKKLFDEVVAGKVNLIAALFRNELAVEGDMLLLTTTRKLLPGPPEARGPSFRQGAGGDE